MRIINLLLGVALLVMDAAAAQDVVVNGVPVYDQHKIPISAHGANIIKDGGIYYLFGEFKTDSANVFTGFACYSSSDLAEWKYERIALPVQGEGRLGPERIGERPKVLRCPLTGEYIMIAHSDNKLYKDPCVVYATSPTVNGEYTYRGPLLYKGRPIKKWDIGSFMDDDGHGYLLVHHGSIYRLSPDFHSLDSCMVADVKGVGESPAMYKQDSTYYWLSSHTTSWERNDNMYFTSSSLNGPWTYKGEFAPKNTLTWNSQTSFVLPIEIGGKTVPMFMGDRWSYPRQRSAATYVWLPAKIENDELSIPYYMEAWDPTTGQPVEISGKRLTGAWQSDIPGQSLSVKFKPGSRVAVKGSTSDKGGYALVSIVNSKGVEVSRQILDFYSLTPSSGLRYISPILPDTGDDYVLNVTVDAISSKWSDKKRNSYGSKGNNVTIDEVLLLD